MYVCFLTSCPESFTGATSPAGEVAKQSRSSPACRAAVKRREWVRKEVEKMEEDQFQHQFHRSFLNKGIIP